MQIQLHLESIHGAYMWVQDLRLGLATSKTTALPWHTAHHHAIFAGQLEALAKHISGCRHRGVEQRPHQ